MRKGNHSLTFPPPRASAASDGDVPVFVDTNLNTHLAMVVSQLDTVADLKGKIKVEHDLCFPDIGNITVQAMKVRRRSSFYHLSDSMLVRCAFDGIKGSWFLHIDAISNRVAQHQAESAEGILNVNDGLQRKHQGLLRGLDASDLEGNREKRLQHLPVTGTSAENGLMLTGKGSMPEKSNLPDDKDADSIHMELEVKEKPGEHENSLHDLEKRSDHDGADIRDATTEINEAVGTGVQLTELEKDTREEGCEDLGVSVNDGYTFDIAMKKVITRKRKGDVPNDNLAERKSEDVPSVKKKHKKGKDGSLENPVHRTKVGKKSDYDKGEPKSEDLKNSSLEKHAGSVIAVASGVLHKDYSLAENLNDMKEKKKKKGASKLHGEAASALPSNIVDTNSPSNMEKISLGTRSSAELDMTDGAGHVQKQITEVVPEEADQNVIVTNPADVNSTVPFFTNPGHSDFNREELSKSGMPDPFSNKNLVRELIGREKHGDLSDSSYANLNQDSSLAITRKEGSALTSYTEVHTEIPTKSGCRRKKSKSDALKKEQSKLGATSELGSEDMTLTEAAGYNLNVPCNDSVSIRAVEDSSDLGNIAKKGSEASHAEVINSHQAEKTELSNQTKQYEALQSRESQPTEVNTLEEQQREQGEKLEGAAILQTAAVGNGSTISFKPTEKNSRLSRKKSKLEMPNHDTTAYVQSLGKDDAEANQKETSGTNCNHPGNDSRPTTTVNEESASLEIPVEVDLLNPSHVHGRKLHGKKKKSGKTDPSNLKSPSIDILRVPEDQHMLREFATVNENAASLEAPWEMDLGITSDAHGRRSRGQKKKSGKTDPVDNPALKMDLHVPENHHKQESGVGPTETHPDEGVNNVFGAFDSEADALKLLTSSSKENDVTHVSAGKVTQENNRRLAVNTRDDGYGIPAASDISFQENDGSTHEVASLRDSGTEAAENASSKGCGESAEIDTDRVNFMKYFVPNDDWNEPVVSGNEVALERELRKPHKERTKRRRKLNVHLEDPSPDKVDTSSSKRPPQQKDSALHKVADMAEQLTRNDHNASKADNGGAGKIEATHNNSSKLEYPSTMNNKKRPGKKLKQSSSDLHHEDPMPADGCAEHHKGKVLASGTNAKTVPHDDIPASEGSKVKNVDSPVRTSSKSAPVTQNHSHVGSDIFLREGMADMVAPDDTTDEGTRQQKRRPKVAVRKISSKRFQKHLEDSKQKKTMQTISGTIFDDASSESSEDGFELRHRSAAVEDNDSTSADSDVDHLKFPEVESAAHNKDTNGINGRDNDIILTQSSNTAKKGMPLSMILKSSSSYKKAKSTASLPQPEDSESQPVDVVFETQPEMA